MPASCQPATLPDRLRRLRRHQRDDAADEHRDRRVEQRDDKARSRTAPSAGPGPAARNASRSASAHAGCQVPAAARRAGFRLGSMRCSKKRNIWSLDAPTRVSRVNRRAQFSSGIAFVVPAKSGSHSRRHVTRTSGYRLSPVRTASYRSSGKSSSQNSASTRAPGGAALGFGGAQFDAADLARDRLRQFGEFEPAHPLERREAGAQMAEDHERGVAVGDVIAGAARQTPSAPRGAAGRATARPPPRPPRRARSARFPARTG